MMGKDSGIEWTDHTFNPWWGCEKVSPACDRCYAETFAKRTGNAIWGKDAPRRFFGDKHWNEPVKWDREAKASGEAALVFCASMADVFEDRRDLDAPRERLWALIEKTPNLRWLLLTKRPENFQRLFPEKWLSHPPVNVWPGVTAENVRRFHERVMRLAELFAWVRWVSYEPALEDISGEIEEWRNWIDWIIVGGESGPGCRPMPLEWARGVLAECKKYDISCFVKQLGGHPNKRHAVEEFPEDLRVREFPRVAV